MTVLNKRTDPIPADAVYIGRGSIWGNPFFIGKHGDRDGVCEKHRRHLKAQIRSRQITIEQLAALRGKDLVCFCAPQRCHGDTLTRAAEWAETEIQKQAEERTSKRTSSLA